MRLIKQSNESEMVYEFLRMEISSDRFGQAVDDVLSGAGIERQIIVDGDISSERENALRAEVLRRYRGYRNEGLFENFPPEIKWVWAIFDKEDLSKIFFMQYSYWNELSNYTGSPLEAAKTIRAGKTVYGVSNEGAINGAQRIRGGNKVPPLIFLTDESGRRYYVLEGHGRMTAYGLAPDMFKDVSVLLGYCKAEDLSRWYGEMPKLPV